MTILKDGRKCHKMGGMHDDLAALSTPAGEETINDGPWCTFVRRDAKSALP